MYLSVAVILIFSKMSSVLTEGHIVLCHPLTGVLSSLSSDLRYPDWTSKIHLQPLVAVIVTCRPGPSPSSSSPPVKPGVGRSVDFVPHGRGHQLGGAKTAILHSERFVATSACEEEPGIFLSLFLFVSVFSFSGT